MASTPSFTELAPAQLPPAAVAAPHSGSLGVFGSVAISAARLPAAQRWHAVQAQDFTRYFSEHCATSGFGGCDSGFVSRIRGVRSSAGLSLDRDLLDRVNRTVNGAMEYRSDLAVWGVGDYWATPAEMASKGAGDCEDFAIAKYWLLRSLGVPDQNLQMVLLQDTRRQLFHAVLVVHTSTGSYVLDNVSNRLETDAAYAQYQPIMSFADGRSYIHGFESGRTVTAMPSDLSAVAPGSEF